jgi:hypothetical protein
MEKTSAEKSRKMKPEIAEKAEVFCFSASRVTSTLDFWKTRVPSPRFRSSAVKLQPPYSTR